MKKKKEERNQTKNTIKFDYQAPKPWTSEVTFISV